MTIADTIQDVFETVAYGKSKSREQYELQMLKEREDFIAKKNAAIRDSTLATVKTVGMYGVAIIGGIVVLIFVVKY